MRRPGTLPASSTSTSRGATGAAGAAATAAAGGTAGGAGMSVDDGASTLSVNERVVVNAAASNSGGGGGSGAAGGGSNTAPTTRSHYSNHSLRRTPQSSQLPSRGGNDCIDRMHSDSRIQNGIPAHHPPPPLPSRHQSSCSQSSYPTLPVNGHGAHHYHHYPRERDKDRSSTRDRNRDRDAAMQSIVQQHRGDKHREAQMELELHDAVDAAGIGTYRA